MNRLAYRFYRIVTSLSHWLERRFTRAGLLVLIAAFITASIGVDMENTMAYQAFACLFALLLVAMICAWFFRGRFEVRRSLPRYASVGQPLIYRVHVRHDTDRTHRDLEFLEDLDDPRPSLREFADRRRSAAVTRRFRRRQRTPRPLATRPAHLKPASIPSLPPRGEAEASVELTPLRRGILRFTGATVARPDPFGLFRGFVRVVAPATVVVLPRRYPLPPIALPGHAKYQQGGVAMASSVGESEEFVSLRDYRPGDPLRRVHWRSWARTGRLIVKEYQDEYFVRHALILDTFAGPEHADALEEAVAVAASFACTVSTHESLLDLMFVGPRAVCFTTGRGVAHAEQALEVLAAVQPCREKPVRALQDLALQHSGAVSGAICVLLDWDDARRELVRQLSCAGLPLLVLLVAEADKLAQLQAEPSLAQIPNLHLLEVGRVAEGLRQLEQARSFVTA